MNLVSQMLHIPTPLSGSAAEEPNCGNSAKDSKDIVVACMQQGTTSLKLFCCKRMTTIGFYNFVFMISVPAFYSGQAEKDNFGTEFKTR